MTLFLPHAKFLLKASILLLALTACKQEKQWLNNTYIGPNGLAEVHILSDSLLVMSSIEEKPDTLPWRKKASYIYTPSDTLQLMDESLVMDGHIFTSYNFDQNLKLQNSDLLNRKFEYSSSPRYRDHYIFMRDCLISYNHSIQQAELDWELVNFQGRQYLKLPGEKNWGRYHYLSKAAEQGFEFICYDPDSLSYRAVQMEMVN